MAPDRTRGKGGRRETLRGGLWALILAVAAAAPCHTQPAPDPAAGKVVLRRPGLKWSLEVDLPGFEYRAPCRFDPFGGAATCSLLLKGESRPPLSVILGIAPVPKGPGSSSSAMPPWIAVIEKEQGMPKGTWKTGEGRYERRWEEFADHGSGSGPGLESLGRASPGGNSGRGNSWVGKGGFQEARSRSHEIHVYGRGEYIAYALLTQEWVADREEWDRILRSVRFVELPAEIAAWESGADRISNEVLGFSFAAPEGTTFELDKRGIYAEGKDGAGALSVIFKAERCNPSEGGSLPHYLRGVAEKRMAAPRPPKEPAPKTIDGKACEWLSARNESLAYTWVVFVRENVRYLFECRVPLDQEPAALRCLLTIGSSFRWGAP